MEKEFADLTEMLVSFINKKHINREPLNQVKLQFYFELDRRIVRSQPTEDLQRIISALNSIEIDEQDEGI